MRPLATHFAFLIVGLSIITFELAKHAIEQLTDRSRT
jgi:hypothetical protein